MKYRDIFLTPGSVAGFAITDSVSLITINAFDYAVPSFVASPNSIRVSIQGKPMEYVAFANADNADNIGKYTINTMNQLVLIGSPLTENECCAVGKFVSGVQVHYQLKPLTYTDNVPTYMMRTYNVNGYLVTASGPAPLNELLNKAQVLDKNQDLNVGGFLTHEIVRSMT